jgi:hypothetical protein
MSADHKQEQIRSNHKHDQIISHVITVPVLWVLVVALIGLNGPNIAGTQFYVSRSSLAFTMDTLFDFSSVWRKLLMREIINTLPPTTFSSEEKRSQAKLEEAVMHLPPKQQALLEHIAIAKVCTFNNTSNYEVADCGPITNTDNNFFLETVSEDC